MEKRNIDIFLEDIFGDASGADYPEQTKAGIAVLSFVYSKYHMDKAETEELIDNLPEWFESMEIEPSISIENTLKLCREKGILNSANRFRKGGEDSGSGVLFLLFAAVLNGDLECTFDREKNSYMFKQTEEGIKKVVEMLKKKDSL